ncbi:MAG TPA: translation initiation factor IF-2 N-terminal domain-containing protein, partial [Acidimicrobiales bacterium]|nr:translation initiation factor IF-2 N-terminal domain-containing protein [Acidimicrobiales bacterium]
MSKKIRVYELARELGLTNKEGLELCLSMGIGVTSHSSSIEEAQADRVRRKAEREGLKRAHAPEEAATPTPSSPPVPVPSTAFRSRPATVGTSAPAPVGTPPPGVIVSAPAPVPAATRVSA